MVVRVPNRRAILRALLCGHRAVRLGTYSWRWLEPWPGKPSLNNQDTSALFRAGLVGDVDDKEMVLTEMGRVVATQDCAT